ASPKSVRRLNQRSVLKTTGVFQRNKPEADIPSEACSAGQGDEDKAKQSGKRDHRRNNSLTNSTTSGID
ncbi:hypothetical protein, partial [uncultured Roseibium sp.]|uniref:hypothetical protein n=1 Tax=uncultured Roseibium sp. TaxID=1936171 RepID=UPI002623E6A7